MLSNKKKLEEALCPVKRDIENEFLLHTKGYKYLYAQGHSIRVAREIIDIISPGYPNYWKEKGMAYVVALLHDVPEMTGYSVEDLRKRYEELKEFTNYYSEDERDMIFSALSAITRNKNESYADYIDRVKKDKLAAVVKVYDITDNLRSCFRTGTHTSLVERYLKALKTLSNSLIIEGQACVDFK